ncbi:hypothetical protein Tco_0157767 [Tanacetum coccineum]
MLSETLRCILNIEDSHGPSVAMHNLQATQSGKTLFKNSRRFTHFYDFLTPELVDIEKVALSSSLRSLKSKGTLSLDAKSHPLISWNLFNTTAGNPVKKILLKLNLSDHRLFKDGGGVNELFKVKEVQRSFCHSDTERLSEVHEVLFIVKIIIFISRRCTLMLAIKQIARKVAQDHNNKYKFKEQAQSRSQ